MSPKAKKRIKWLAVRFAFLYFAVQLLSELFIPTREVNYRLDVTFEVDGVPVTGSGVQKLVVSRVMPILGSKQLNWSTSGEAVIVDLPKIGSVFVLLTSPRDDGIYTFATKGRFDFLFSDACQLLEKGEDRSWSSLVRFVGRYSGTCSILSKDLPPLVHFKDENNPATVERVYPDHPQDALGASVKFSQASLTITNEPITTGIQNRLKWLSNDYEKRLVYAPSSTPPFPAILKHGYFKGFLK